MRLELLPEAQQDVREIVAYYKTLSSDLSLSFMASVADTLTRLEVFPQSGMLVGTHIRRVLVKHFPYSVFIRLKKMFCLILSVAHIRRKPRDWDDR